MGNISNIQAMKHVMECAATWENTMILILENNADTL